MGAGGDMGKTQAGFGGQAAGRPMTPFSVDRGGGGMQGANTGSGGMLGGFPSGPIKSMSGMEQQAPGYGGGQMGNLGQMASLIQGGGQMPPSMMPFQQSQGQTGNLGQMASLLQGGGQMPQSMMPYKNLPSQMPQQAPGYGGQFPQSLMPFQQSQGMAPQAPATQSPMQQGLGGLGAYLGGGAGGGGGA